MERVIKSDNRELGDDRNLSFPVVFYGEEKDAVIILCGIDIWIDSDMDILQKKTREHEPGFAVWVYLALASEQRICLASA